MFLFFHYPVFYLQHDVLKQKQFKLNVAPISFLQQQKYSHPLCARVPSHIQVWASCPLLWQQLSPAYRWWERSFPHPLAAAPREWFQCRVQGRRCPQHGWYPRHQTNLEENGRGCQKHATSRIKVTHQVCSPGRRLPGGLQPGGEEEKAGLTGHVEDTVAGIDVGKESISKSLSRVSSLHQSSNVHNI